MLLDGGLLLYMSSFIPNQKKKQGIESLDSGRVFFFERERQKICHSNILEEVKINFTNRHSPIKLNNKDLDRTLTQKENDPKNPP
jgi:hypothetical protein